MSCQHHNLTSRARELWLIPGFPRTEEATEAVVTWLGQNCRDDAQVDVVIGSALNDWEEWKGLPALYEIYRGNFLAGLE
jgi:hypothetical protein